MGSVSELVHYHFLPIIWYLAIIYSSGLVWKYIRGISVSWFKPAECIWDDSQSWTDVFLILTRDPLDVQEGFFRGKSPRSLFQDLLRFSALAIALCLTSFYVLAPNPKVSFTNDFGFFVPTKQQNGLYSTAGSGFETLIAALVALGGALYTTISQLKAKVRSENRQKWIDEVRNEIAILIHKIPTILDILPEHDRNPIRKKINLNRVRLELLLNPSERDHRTLCVFLRVAYRFDEIEPDLEVWRQLAPFGISRDTIDPWFGELEIDERRSRRIVLISMVIRLSNALLKREWELVKFGR